MRVACRTQPGTPRGPREAPDDEAAASTSIVADFVATRRSGVRSGRVARSHDDDEGERATRDRHGRRAGRAGGRCDRHAAQHHHRAHRPRARRRPLPGQARRRRPAAGDRRHLRRRPRPARRGAPGPRRRRDRLARGADAADRQRPLVGARRAAPQPAARLRGRGLARRVRLLARRAAQEARGRRGRAERARGGPHPAGGGASTRPRRPRPATTRSASAPRSASLQARPLGGDPRRRARWRRPAGRHAAPPRPALRLPLARAAAGRRPRARPLRRLVRALPALAGPRPDAAGRDDLRRGGVAPAADRGDGLRRRLPAADPPDRPHEPQGPQQHAGGRPGRRRVAVRHRLGRRGPRRRGARSSAA